MFLGFRVQDLVMAIYTYNDILQGHDRSLHVVRPHNQSRVSLCRRDFVCYCAKHNQHVMLGGLEACPLGKIYTLRLYLGGF